MSAHIVVSTHLAVSTHIVLVVSLSRVYGTEGRELRELGFVKHVQVQESKSNLTQLKGRQADGCKRGRVFR